MAFKTKKEKEKQVMLFSLRKHLKAYKIALTSRTEMINLEDIIVCCRLELERLAKPLPTIHYD